MKRRTERDQRQGSDSRAQLEREEVLDVMEDRFSCIDGQSTTRNAFLQSLFILTFLDSGQDRRKVIVYQDNSSRLFRDISSTLAHGDSDICHLQCRRIVD